MLDVNPEDSVAETQRLGASPTTQSARVGRRRARSNQSVRSSAVTAGDTPPVIRLGPFTVFAGTAADLTKTVVISALQALGIEAWIVFALHVGGLNAAKDLQFVEAMDNADLVYADGVSVVALARLAGNAGIQRAATTDIGWLVIAGMAAGLGRPVRLALVGGSPGLAERAAAVLKKKCAAEVVSCEHGYHSQWGEVLERVRAARPDIVLVGLGAPQEMKWVHANRVELPAALILTCGGWFGFIAGDEHRAPLSLQRLGLEWLYRLVSNPGRLGRRYLRGAVVAGKLAVHVLVARVLSRLHS